MVRQLWSLVRELEAWWLCVMETIGDGVWRDHLTGSLARSRKTSRIFANASV